MTCTEEPNTRVDGLLVAAASALHKTQAAAVTLVLLPSVMLIEQSKANETETGCVAVVLSVFFAILLLYNRTSQSSNASARDSQSTVFTIITNLDFIHPLANLFCIG